MQCIGACENGAVLGRAVVMMLQQPLAKVSMSGQLQVKQGSVMKGGKLALQMSLQKRQQAHACSWLHAQ